MAIPVPPDLLSILADLPTSLLVGGCVRDTLLGLPIRDFDVEVYGMDYAECREILTRHGRVDETGKKFSVFKVTTSAGSTHDVSLATRENKTGPRHTDFERVADKNLGPKDGAMRRDFTINAMAWNPRTGELLDFYGGQADLRSRTLRATSDKFADDPLRVLRGMQFAGRFELIADPSLCYTTWEIRDEFQHLSKERVREEWSKWATQSVVPSMGLEFLSSCGWLSLFPELQVLDGNEQDPIWHPEGDTWRHTLHCCDAMAASPGWFKRPAAERLELMLGILCHDLGKPSTTGTKVDEEGRTRITAYGHDIAGIEPTESLLTNLGFGQERGFIGRITPLVEFHMAHIRQNFGTPTGVRRLAFDLMPQTLMNLGMVQYSDHSGRPPLPGGLPEKMATVLVLAHELGCAHGKQVPLLSGRDVLGLIPGLKPGPVVGVLLDAMYQAQLDGEFFSVEEAGQWLRRNRGHLLENGGLAPKRIMDGAELIRLGLTPGPRFGEAHRALFDLQLDGKIHSWEDAAQWLVDHFFIAEDHLHCGRSACRQPLSRHWNRVTRKFYCTPCARLLNDNPTHDGIPLCDWPDPDAA